MPSARAQGQAPQRVPALPAQSRTSPAVCGREAGWARLRHSRAALGAHPGARTTDHLTGAAGLGEGRGSSRRRGAGTPLALQPRSDGPATRPALPTASLTLSFLLPR